MAASAPSRLFSVHTKRVTMNEQDDVFDEDEDDNIDNTYLNFGIAGEDYAINVGHVTEIVRLQKVFAVPDVQAHVRGVINLRGKVIPLLDVRTRFGLAFADYTDRTVVVVIELEGTPTGLVVDGVSGICEIPPDQVEPAPSTMRTADHSLICGLGKRGERVSFIIDVPTLVTTRGVTHHRKIEELRTTSNEN